MKKFIALSITTALAAGAMGAAQAQANVGVSIGINQPGIYGRINIGNLPPPLLVLPQPVIISQPRVVVERQPIYLYVPPVQQQDWRRYCGRYEACGQPVYFVQERWVRERYEEQHPGWNNGRHLGWDKKAGKKMEKMDKHDRDDDRDEGHGKGHSKKHRD